MHFHLEYFPSFTKQTPYIFLTSANLNARDNIRMNVSSPFIFLFIPHSNSRENTIIIKIFKCLSFYHNRLDYERGRLKRVQNK